MVPGGQGIATKESDMYQQKLVWSEGPLSVYEWSKLYIGAHGGIDRDATFKDYKFQLR